jgi:alkylhydroperoxidase family enzyme
MLKIANTDSATERRWTLSGQLTGPWAAELLSQWEKAHDARDRRQRVVDLSDVTFIDENGEDVLRTMSNAGVHFLVFGVDTKYLVENLGTWEGQPLRRCIFHLKKTAQAESAIEMAAAITRHKRLPEESLDQLFRQAAPHSAWLPEPMPEESSPQRRRTVMRTITEEKLFAPVTAEAAPKALLPVLEHVNKIFGFIPNLMATLANAPAAAKGYHGLISEFSKSSLTPQELQIVLLAASVENKGIYCTAAHSAAAKSLAQIPDEVIGAIRNGHPVPDPKINALVLLTREIVRDRGFVKPQTMRAFVLAGYRNEQVLEILLGVAVKTISNYLDHISAIDIDLAFQGIKAM